MFDITLWLVGENAEAAKESLLFDSYESAASYQRDNLGTNIYSVTAMIDFSTIELEAE